MAMGQVTVLIPTYNHGNVLAYQIDSLLRQTSPPQKIIILDDGSTDETPAIVAGYQENETIQVIRQEKNTGLHAALVLLLSQVNTEYFAFAAADDILTRDWCAITAGLLDKYADAKMAISNTFIFENNQMSVTNSINSMDGKSTGVCTPTQYLQQLLRFGKFPPSNTILYRTDIIEEFIRPIILRKELGSLIDVLLILAIATKYPIAYSTRPTGVFIRDRESYGNSFFSNDHLNKLITNIELFSIRDRFLCREAMMFAITWVKYTWAKQAILKASRVNENENSGLRFLFNSSFNYFQLFFLFCFYQRFKFIRLANFNSNVGNHDIKNFIDGSLFKRFDST